MLILQVCCCGLVVNPSLPWLGASLDGLVHDPSKPLFGLLEVKCPYTQRLSTVEKAVSDPDFFCSFREGKVTLKQSHKHYYQVQGQMALACVPWCDFVIHTFKIIHGERIRFDRVLEWHADTVDRVLFSAYFTTKCKYVNKCLICIS